jgi:uncharacterized membrane protein YbhN (UPF0104 family)
MSFPDATADLALPGLDTPGFGDRAAWRSRLRPLALPLALGAVVVGVAFALGGPLDAFANALRRAIDADIRWVAAGVAFEALSFAGYVLLLRHVAGRRAPRFGLRASYQVTLAGAAVTRLLPTAGAGGVALTLWSLRRAGLRGREGVRTLLTFLVLLYTVFFAAIAVSGVLLATGAASGDGPLALSLIPGLLGLGALLGALALGLRHPRRGGAPDLEPGTGRVHRVVHGAGVLGEAVHEALREVRRPRPQLLGAVAWWLGDVAVLWATLSAFGSPPPLAVLALAYFVGQIANTLPLPGAVSGGMVGILIAFGVAADLALVSVLAYRALALWLPAPAGAMALAGLRSTARRWARDDEAEQAPAAESEQPSVVWLPASAPVMPRPLEMAA